MSNSGELSSVILLKWIDERMRLLAKHGLSLGEAEALERISDKVLVALEHANKSNILDVDQLFLEAIPLFKRDDAHIRDLVTAGTSVKQLLARLVQWKEFHNKFESTIEAFPTNGEPRDQSEFMAQHLIKREIKEEPFDGQKLARLQKMELREEVETAELAKAGGERVLRDKVVTIDEQRDLHVRLVQQLAETGNGARDVRFAISIETSMINYGFPTTFTRFADIDFPEEAILFVKALDQLIGAYQCAHLGRGNCDSAEREELAEVCVPGKRHDFRLELDHQGRAAWLRAAEVMHPEGKGGRNSVGLQHELYLTADLLPVLRNQMSDLLDEFN